MNFRMREVLNKYKSIILPLVLVLVFALCTALTWGKWGHIIYDCFREAIIPEALLDGKVLYRDITNLYPPLGYQFNALLFLIFGNSLNVLYWAGIINSFLILSIVYLLAKKHSSSLTAFITVLSVMALLTFRVYPSTTTFSWFFPYSYSFIYAFSTCLLSLLACVLYAKNKKPLCLYLSFLFIGLSIAFKLDFVLFALIPLFYLVKNTIQLGFKNSIKPVFISIICLVAPFFASLLTYLTTGGAISDLQNEIGFLSSFSKAHSVIKFNKSTMPQSFSPWVLKAAFTSFLHFVVITLVLSLYTALSGFFISKLKPAPLKAGLGFILFCIGYFIIIKPVAMIQYSGSELFADLVYVPYIVTISALAIFISKAAKNKGFRGLEFSECEKFYFLITFSAFLISFRTFALVYAGCVGNFMLVVWWMAFAYLLLELAPKYFPEFFKKKNLKTALLLFFIIYPLYFICVYISNSAQMTYKLDTKKGAFFGSNKYIHTINETAKFINEEIPKDKTFLVSEEGLVLNYMTGRKADLKYYALIPHMVDTFGEENIIEDLAKNPPDYFLVTNNIYVTETLGGAFGIHYARKIAAFIVQNYDYIKTIKNPKTKEGLEITVFRLKEK